MIRKNLLVILTVIAVFFAAFFGGMLAERNNLRFFTENKQPPTTIKKQLKPNAPPVVKYGINFSGFVALDKKVEKNEAFSDILLKHNVAYQTVKSLFSRKNDTLFNPKNVVAGHSYTVLGENTDTGFVAKKVIYEENKVDYIIFHLDDSLYIFRGQHAVERKKREVAGVITLSLYDTFDAWDVPASFAPRIAEIFSSTIDFYKVKEGDRFKLVFEQDYIDGKPIGDGVILALLFETQGNSYYAYYFEKDKSHEGEYYDEKGNSMRKAFLKSPVKYGRISSRFTMNRFHPVTKIWKAHLGTDYAAPYGTPILATADGVVEEARFAVFNGNFVKIRHNGQYKTQYLHMSKIARGVRSGRKVRQGEVIGYVGSTGLATGPHVCYRFWKDGKQVDPHRQKLKFSEELPKKQKEQFLASITDYNQAFDNLLYNKVKSNREIEMENRAAKEAFDAVMFTYF